MVSTRTTAQSQREVQRLDCSVPGLSLSWLLVVHIVRPLGVALVLYWKQRAWRGQGAAVAGGDARQGDMDWTGGDEGPGPGLGQQVGQFYLLPCGQAPMFRVRPP